MLICKECFDNEETKLEYEPDQTWEAAEKLYDQCEICERTILCAEL